MPDSPYASRPWLSSYAEEVPHEIEQPSQTLPELLAASVHAHGSRPALEFFGATTTYAELGDLVDRAGANLFHIEDFIAREMPSESRGGGNAPRAAGGLA